MWFLERTQVSEGPGHLVPVPFDVSFFTVSGTQHFGDVACHTGLFGNANYHNLSFRMDKDK